MSNLRANYTSEPIAILCSDLHLSHTAPVARSAEPDWYKAMDRQLIQLRRVRGVLEVPVICAGDIFHKWDSPAELINFAIKALPPGMYTIPGQHDLPNHNYKDIKRSAYWTLVSAGVIKDLGANYRTSVSNKLDVTAFPWGFDPFPLDERPASKPKHLAVIHAYCWMKDHSYPGAPPKGEVSRWWKKLEGYDAALFGDNHKAFGNLSPGGCEIFNHGTFFRRNIDERWSVPAVGILRADGTITRHAYNTDDDVFSDKVETIGEEDDAGMTEFVSSLDDLGEMFLDFKAAVTKWLDTHTVPKSVRRAVLKLLEQEKK